MKVEKWNRSADKTAVAGWNQELQELIKTMWFIRRAGGPRGACRGLEK